jgi:hypothetical protein
MTTRFAARALVAALLASTAACSSEVPTAAGPSAEARLRRGDRPTAVAVAGLWDGQFPIPDRPNATREWTLNLVQRDEKLEGSLTTTLTTEEGRTFQSTSSLVSGSGISGRVVTVVFPTAEGAETKATYTAELSADGKSMTGWYSFGTQPITLVRR